LTKAVLEKMSNNIVEKRLSHFSKSPTEEIDEVLQQEYHQSNTLEIHEEWELRHYYFLLWRNRKERSIVPFQHAAWSSLNQSYKNRLNVVINRHWWEHEPASEQEKKNVVTAIRYVLSRNRNIFNAVSLDIRDLVNGAGAGDQIMRSIIHYGSESLKSLTITGRALAYGCMQGFRQCLTHNQLVNLKHLSLTDLDSAYHALYDDEEQGLVIPRLAEALGRNTTLERVCLKFRMRDSFVKSFFEVLSRQRTNHSWQTLSIETTYGDRQSYEYLPALFKTHRVASQLQYLNIDYVSFCEEAVANLKLVVASLPAKSLLDLRRIAVEDRIEREERGIRDWRRDEMRSWRYAEFGDYVPGSDGESDVSNDESEPEPDPDENIPALVDEIAASRWNKKDGSYQLSFAVACLQKRSALPSARIGCFERPEGLHSTAFLEWFFDTYGFIHSMIHNSDMNHVTDMANHSFDTIYTMVYEAVLFCFGGATHIQSGTEYFYDAHTLDLTTSKRGIKRAHSGECHF